MTAGDLDLKFTRDQRRAALALSQVQGLAGRYPKGHEERNRYGAMAHSLPALIRSAGLAQALAFVQSRKKDGTNALLEHLAKVVIQRDRGDDLVGKSISTADLREYMRLTQEVLAALLWYKRFAQTVLEVQPGAEATP